MKKLILALAATVAIASVNPSHAETFTKVDTAIVTAANFYLVARDSCPNVTKDETVKLRSALDRMMKKYDWDMAKLADMMSKLSMSQDYFNRIYHKEKPAIASVCETIRVTFDNVPNWTD